MTVQEMTPAEIYDRCFVPALFGQWGKRIAEYADIQPGHRVLDVATGTGVLAAAAYHRAGDGGRVVGLDPNPDMLAVAKRKQPALEWVEGVAERLDFPSNHFDRVLSQFGFMFFVQPVQALQEMLRVLKPGGRLAVAVCDGLDHSPGYAVFAELLQRLFGNDVADSFRAPFRCGSRNLLQDYASQAGIADLTVKRKDGEVQFASIAELVATERACAWTLGGILNDEEFSLLSREAEESLSPFVNAGKRISFGMPVLVMEASKPGS